MNPIEAYFNILANNNTQLIILFEEQLKDSEYRTETNKTANEIRKLIPVLSFGDAQSIVYHQLAKIAFQKSIQFLQNNQ